MHNWRNSAMAQWRKYIGFVSLKEKGGRCESAHPFIYRPIVGSLLMLSRACSSVMLA